ncbi:DUF4179 domain-containing protein [Oceanobacillus jordanicus]|uniref:DUF4179 domain-containing protein n=1 Tax=Oceanobacillus jordanicus TaxID=2867266 RepID=A0AAW5BCD1_9BACI|nr:DUF4179 domain-containing protein [Oceanobacillus jordanicus]MCG3420768.1 DUF4179 domain-containing protein [Oceanobacillus jordanicus]
MSNKVKRELEKIEIPEELHNRAKLGVMQAKKESEKKNQIADNQIPTSPLNKKVAYYKRILIVAAICLTIVSTLTFTPALAAIQEVYNKIFTSEHIDDTGVRMAVISGKGQALDQTFYDKKYDITVHFDRVLTDDKETKLLLTYQSEETNLENHYIDLFEGVSSINLIVESGQKVPLDNVGWGSSYYDSKENKITEALSFASIKEYADQEIRLEIENLTIWNDSGMESLQTTWPLEFKLKPSAVSDRETVEVNKEFTFKGETYNIKQVEFSDLETRVVVTGSDTKLLTDESGMQYRVMSKLEHQFLNARKNSKEYGYSVDDEKSGVFLQSANEKIDPIFSKGEVEGAEDEYVMTFAPVEDRQGSILKVGEEIKIPLTK